MTRMRSQPAGFKRLRTRSQLLILSRADRAGPLLTELDRVHVRQVRQAFSTEGASTGSSWPALSPGYAKWKRRAYPGRRILTRSRDMRNKFEQSSNPGHVRRWLGGLRFGFGVIDEKAWRHENAAGVGHQRLPRRSVIQKTAAQLQEFTRAFIAFYIKRVRQALRHS